MSSSIPETMRSLCVSAYNPPSKYEISSVPTPKITSPHHVLVKVHAASMNPADNAIAAGKYKMLVKLEFPLKIGFDLSGTVVAIGDSVKELAVGDEVFGCTIFQELGTISEFAVVTDTFLVPKPKNISHAEAASIPLVGLTALQSFDKVKGGVEGKTVFVTAGLGGVGSLACQIAKNALGAGKVITTVSTEKVGKLSKLLGEGVVDQVVDYRKNDLLTEIPHGSVDVLIDYTHSSLSYLPLLLKGKGAIISNQGSSNSKNVKRIIPEIPVWIKFVLNLSYWYYSFRIVYLAGLQFEPVLQKPTREGMQTLTSWIEEGKLKPIVGKTLKLEDIVAIRKAYMQLSSGKGGIGKVVVEMV